ncbi:MAG: YfhO family protein [Flavisolibacter sp.]|nr:YfhO family protein [Flavisolibacter sp.]
MNKGLFSKLLPHIIAVVIFLLIAVLYCKPVLEGKVLSQTDIVGWKGMAQQSIEFKEKYGHYPLWTNSLFSGMPAYTIAMDAAYKVQTIYLYLALNLFLPKPADFFFLACICFYFLCLVLRIRPWIAILGALAFAYSTYNPIIIGVGHDTKMRAIALMPAVIASLLLILKKRYLWGTALLALFFGFQVATQHLQIIYYTGLVIGFLIIAYLVYNWKKESIKTFAISGALALAAVAIGFFSYSVVMMPVNEYAKETMRGGRSELTDTTNIANKSKGGLDKDYAFNWSYGTTETFTFIVPGIFGGSNGGREHSETTAVTDAGVPEDQAIQIANGYSYWGDQPSTSGPVYLGAVICFLFILGMVYLKSWHKWWIIAATIFGILLSWGKNFEALNYFLFDYMPLYNKFRAPSMALVIPQLTFPLTAALVLNQITVENIDREKLWAKFKMSAYITAGLLAILFVLYISFSYKGTKDTAIADNFSNMMLSQASRSGQQITPQIQDQAQAFGKYLISALQKDRKSHFGSDLFRSFAFILLAVLLVGAYLKNKIKPTVMIIGLLLLSTIDLMAIDRRYLNDDNFVDKDEYESSFVATQADKQIMADPAKPFRVFDETDPQGPFQGSRASYFHNSIGGYHPAKLGLYQDIIEHQISRGNMEVFNMLNTKYFITQNPATGASMAQLNPNANGPVWFVKAIQFVPNADAEMNALSTLHLKDTAVAQQKFASHVKQQPQFDSSATIKVTEYLNDKITYTSSSNTNQFAVFSEVYYPHGWNAYIDGQKADYIKVDYVLRGMSVPAGKHTIEFRFEPQSYKTANTLMLIATLLTFALLIAAIVFQFLKRRKEQPVAIK